MGEIIREKLSFKIRFGYGIGQMVDSLPYNFLSVYAMFFLTNVAGVPVAIAGTIGMIAILWDAVTDPAIGFLSDNCSSKYGRRRPFMIVSLVPFCLMTVLSFTYIDLGHVGTIVYFIIVAIFYRTCYTGYVIPYFSLGAEITQDYDERVKLQCISAYFAYFAVWFCTAGPMAVLSWALGRGISYRDGWIISAIFLAACMLICGFISWNSLRGREMVNKRDDILEKNATKGVLEVFKTYADLLKDKICIYVILLRLAYTFSGAVSSAAFVYLMSVNLELSEAQQSLYWTLYSAIYIVDVFICNYISDKTDKRFILGASVVLCIIASTFFYFHNVNSFTELIIMTALISFSGASFWSVGATMLYDYNEVVEFKTGKRQEGAVSGVIIFATKVGGAISYWLSGLILAAIGYDGTATVFTASVKHGILALNTIVPAGISVVILIFIIIYPITRKNFALLRQALELKNAGKEYSTEGFERLL